jgi:hypothetical protein
MEQQELNLESFKKIMGEDLYNHAKGRAFKNDAGNWNLLMDLFEITL